MLEVRLLGTFAIKHDGKPVVISSRAAQSLFAYLVLTAGKLHRREKLAGMFWPEAPERKARAYLRYELWRLRKALFSAAAVDYLLADDMTISFDVSSEYWLDVSVFLESHGGSSTHDLMDSLVVYQGELLPGFYDSWITEEREHLQAQFEQKMGRLLELLECETHWPGILDWAERWIALGDATEVAYQYLMIAYAALGDPAKVLATYDRCAQALAKLDLEPSERTRALALKRSPKINIPIPLTSFIGRENELKEIADLLSRSRLVTLTGSGGVGKTRLAIQVVADVLERFPHGVWFLDLAPLTDPALIPSRLASLLGPRESGELSVPDLLKNYFHARTCLVIFDNCEHLIEAAAQLVYSLLTACQHLSILATSREPLRVSGEIPYRVPSLEVPKPDTEFTIEQLTNIESVRLFTERAMFTSFGFAINLQNAHVITQICRRLDGIPFAIELAAARTNVMTVDQILKRLDDRFKLLTAGLRSALPRHQTLRAMIEWSYELLSEKEKLLFRRLAVFSGGWTLDAAEHVCSADGIERSEILDLLTQLVNKSLMVVETWASEPRYRRLETVRQFAREELFETSQTSKLQDRHLDYFLKKAQEIEPYLMGAEQSTWMNYLDAELDNLRLALDWSISNRKGEEAFGLFGSLTWFCYIHCHCREGLEWFRQVLVLRNTVSKKAQAKAIGGAGWLNFAVADLSAASALHRESAELYRELDDLEGLSTQLQFAGVNEFGRGNLAQARADLEESLKISRRINNKPAMPRVLMHLGHFSEMEGDQIMAWQYFEEALGICREIGEGHLTMVILGTMGYYLFMQRDNLQARKYYKESLEIGIKLKKKRTIAEELLSFAEILCAEERYAESAQLQGFAETLFNESESLTEWHLETLKRTAAIPKKSLGEESYRKEFNIGKTLKLEEAVEIAVKQEL